MGGYLKRGIDFEGGSYPSAHYDTIKILDLDSDIASIYNKLIRSLINGSEIGEIKKHICTV